MPRPCWLMELSIPSVDLADAASLWTAAGFSVVDGVVDLGNLRVCLGAAQRGLGLSGDARVTGIATRVVKTPSVRWLQQY